jgi:hypothetical protein
MVKKVILILMLISFILPARVRAEEAGSPGAAGEDKPVSQPATHDDKPAATQPAGQAKVVVEIPRTQWCQCVRAILNVEGGNIAGCVKSGASEEKLKIFRGRGEGSGSTKTVTALLAFAGCSESENENVGSLSFDVQWQGQTISPPQSKEGATAKNSEPPVAPITCEEGGIASVEATLYRMSKAKLASAGPWNCSNPISMLNNIPVASNLRLVVIGKNAAGAVLYRGEQSGITISYRKTTALGTIAAQPFTPVLSAPADEEMLPTGRVRFAWTGPSGATSYRIQVSNDPQFTTTIDNTTASASYEAGTDLASRTYFWRVMATDAFKNSSKWSPSRSVTVDAEPPVNTTAAKFINGGAALTNSTAVSLAISATKKMGVTAYHISERPEKPAPRKEGWVAIPSAASYAATIPYTLSKGDGEKKIYVWFKDALGRLSRVKSGSIVLDTALPHATITSHPSLTTNSTSASFGFSSTKEGSTFQCRIDGGAYSACPGTKSYEGLPDGPHTFTVKAIDRANNVDPNPASFTWTIDSAAPDTTITSQPLIRTNSTSASFGFTSTKTGSTFQCRLDGGAFAVCASPQNYPGLADGSHTFTVAAIDEVGNIDPAPAKYTWAVDTAPFGTIITSQPSNPTSALTASFSFTSRKAGATFQCSLDGGGFSACASPTEYSWLAEGNHSFMVKAIDDIGNEDPSPARYDWQIRVPPINTTRPGFINRRGAYFIDNKTVKLSISAKSEKGVSGYFASESPVTPDASDPGWKIFPAVKVYARNVGYALSEATGQKRVYIWFKDDSGNVSDVKSDTIYKFNSYYVILVLLVLQVAMIV